MGGVVGDAGVQVVVWVWGGRAHLRVAMPLYDLTRVVVYISD